MSTHSLPQIVSQILGWGYFLSWSTSFYPQVILNWRRKSVNGLSIDFTILNAIGHTCYAVYASNFYFNSDIQKEYRRRHRGNDSTVALNDVAFAVHASILAWITLAQTFYYPRGSGQQLSLFNRVIITLFVLLVALDTTSVLKGAEHGLDVLYHLSYFKLWITLSKYVPQVYMNWSRQSTVGWSIQVILLDFTGGALSLSQMLFDAYMESNWSSITGNPIKLGLSTQTLIFDLIFMVQHYILYRHSWKKSSDDISKAEEANERTPLIGE
ncbi:hypothetical protein FRC03_011509 [Tulasnella sp. 419]|nr:hypothetical protein FRC02_008480 [Tulasnella sp. 418]KAG8966674.1 hypothetical protein FRC03_011509 [Tulasnella sp. 419]